MADERQPPTLEEWRLAKVEATGEDNAREISGLKEREGGRDTQLELNNSLMKQLIGAFLTLIVAIIAAVITFVLNGGGS